MEKTDPMKVPWLTSTVSERGEYACKREFVRIFEREHLSLLKLAQLLTVNSEVAKRCLIRSFGECISNNSVFKEWAFNWARRMIIRSAINLVIEPGHQSSAEAYDEQGDEFISLLPSTSAITTTDIEFLGILPEFDRFVFVICDLEHYSIHECASLLSRSPKQVCEARKRTGTQMKSFDESSDISQRLAMH